MLDVVMCGDLCGDRARCALKGCMHGVLAASRWRSFWEAGCQQLTAEMGVND